MSVSPDISSTRPSSENTNLGELVPAFSLAPAPASATFSATPSRASSNTSSSSEDDAAGNALSSEDEEPRKEAPREIPDGGLLYGYRRVRTPELPRPQPRPRRPSQALPKPVQMLIRPATPTPGFSHCAPSGQLSLPSLATLALPRHAAQANLSPGKPSRGKSAHGMLLNSPPLTDMLVIPSLQGSPEPATSLSTSSLPAKVLQPVPDSPRPASSSLLTLQSSTSRGKPQTPEDSMPPPAPRPSYRQLFEPKPHVSVFSTARSDRVDPISLGAVLPKASTESTPLAPTSSGANIAQSSLEREGKQTEPTKRDSFSPTPEFEDQRQASECHRENEQYVQQILRDLRILSARKAFWLENAEGVSHSKPTLPKSNGSNTLQTDSSPLLATSSFQTAATAPDSKESDHPYDTRVAEPVYHPSKSPPLHFWLESVSKGQEPPEVGAQSEPKVGDFTWKPCDCCIGIPGLWGLRAQRLTRPREPTDEPPEYNQPEYRAAMEKALQQAERRDQGLKQKREAEDNKKKRKSNATAEAEAETLENKRTKKPRN